MPVVPLRASDFIASEGVNTHINYNDGAYANLANIISNLAFLGITHVRDGLNTPGQFGSPAIAAYETVAQAGIKFTLMVGGGGAIEATNGTPTNPSLDQRIGFVAQLARSVPGSVAAVEGTNEINNQPISYSGQGGTGAAQLAAAVSMQRALYSLVHADATLKGVPVYYFTGYDAGDIPLGPNPAATPGLADFDTQHPYPNGGEPPAEWVSRARALPNETAADAAAKAPAVYTETGYSSNGGTSGSVNLDVQAKYTLDLLLDAAANGIAETDLYELLDAYAPGSPQGDAGYGMFDHNGSSKPVAVAIHNMNAILMDSGAAASTFTPFTLPYVVAGASGTGHDLEMARSDGSHVITLWDEQPIWDMATGTQTAAVIHHETITLNGGAGAYTISQYDPLQGTTPVATFAGVSKVTVAVSDHPVFLVVNQTDLGGDVLSPGSTDRISIMLSEDAYQGDAQYLVRVDGKDVGTPGYATASHAAGLSTEASFLVASTGTPHTVAVSFLNDSWGGTPQTDRNLYVDSVAVNGTAIAGSTAALFSNGTATFTEAPRLQPVPQLQPVTPQTESLSLQVSEDEYQGHAAYTVSVDGTQVGGQRTASASHVAGASETVQLGGGFSTAAHKVSVSFLNDKWDGTPQTDRNFYVDSVDVNGKAAPGTSAALYSNGTADLTTPAVRPGMMANVEAAQPATPISLLTLSLSEDAYLGDARFIVSLDGMALNEETAVTASHRAAATQDFAFQGRFAAGTHDLALSFTNDKWNGTPDTDRNLYLDAVKVNGATYSSSTLALYSQGTQHLQITVPQLS